MNESAVLYALSTIAQTCAALAAFVGTMGIFGGCRACWRGGSDNLTWSPGVLPSMEAMQA